MRKTPGILLIVFFLFFSCTHNLSVYKSPENFEKFTKKINGKVATLTTIDSLEQNVLIGKVTKDSVYYIDSGSRKLETRYKKIHLSEIQTIKYKSASKGGFEGFLIGFAFGASIFAFQDSEDNKEFYKAFTLGSGGLFGFVGLLMGRHSESKQIYYFEKPQPVLLTGNPDTTSKK